jgi:ABC-type multidrug transport system fused ATPase/permease subunit
MVSDSSVALGVLQLTALALPVFAFFLRVYISNNSRGFSIPGIFATLFGVVGLTLAATFSSQFLYNRTNSEFIELSLYLVPLSLSGILLVVYEIYSESARDMKQKVSNLEEDIEEASHKKLIEHMKNNELSHTSEIEVDRFSMVNEMDEGKSLSELERIQEKNNIMRELVDEIPKTDSPITYITLEHWRIIVIGAVIFSAVAYFLSAYNLLIEGPVQLIVIIGVIYASYGIYVTIYID